MVAVMPGTPASQRVRPHVAGGRDKAYAFCTGRYSWMPGYAAPYRPVPGTYAAGYAPKPAERNFCPECGSRVNGLQTYCPACWDNGVFINLDEYVSSVNNGLAHGDIVTSSAELARILGVDF